MAQVIARVNRPTLVMAHNKTLAAQLFQEFRRFFPENAVEYFVSYYDYYQPEAYVPASDTYIEKESTINDEIDRHAPVGHALALRAARRHHRRQRVLHLRPGLAGGVLRPGAAARARPAHRSRRRSCASWSRFSTSATTSISARGTFRVRGDIVEVYPSYEEVGAAHRAVRRRDRRADVVRSADRQGRSQRHDRTAVYPKSHFVTRPRAPEGGRRDDQGRSSRSRRGDLEREGKLLEAQRLHQRTMFDLEMIKEIGYCHGIENYSRHLTRAPGGRAAADAARLPAADALVVVDESHQTVPQVRGMYHGDRSRKEVLVEYGFRLPSALDNRPLNFEEWEAARQPAHLRLGDAGPLRTEEVRRRGRRAGDPADRPDGSADRGAAGEGAGR